MAAHSTPPFQAIFGRSRLANKLTQAHINFLNQKMKVRLAVQIFSSSCAKLSNFLNESKTYSEK